MGIFVGVYASLCAHCACLEKSHCPKPLEGEAACPAKVSLFYTFTTALGYFLKPKRKCYDKLFRLQANDIFGRGKNRDESGISFTSCKYGLIFRTPFHQLPNNLTKIYRYFHVALYVAIRLFLAAILN